MIDFQQTVFDIPLAHAFCVHCHNLLFDFIGTCLTLFKNPWFKMTSSVTWNIYFTPAIITGLYFMVVSIMAFSTVITFHRFFRNLNAPLFHLPEFAPMYQRTNTLTLIEYLSCFVNPACSGLQVPSFSLLEYFLISSFRNLHFFLWRLLQFAWIKIQPITVKNRIILSKSPTWKYEYIL